jgi:hypothetical protein
MSVVWIRRLSNVPFARLFRKMLPSRADSEILMARPVENRRSFELPSHSHQPDHAMSKARYDKRPDRRDHPPCITPRLDGRLNDDSEVGS